MQQSISGNVAIPAPSPRPTNAEVDEDEWFAPTSSSTDCAVAPRASSLTPSTTRFLVVFDRDVAGVVELIEQAGTVSQTRVVLPVVELETHAESAASLQGQDGIIAVLPALGGLAGSRTFAHGFDLLIGLARLQNEQVSEFRYGGRLKGDTLGYPVLVKGDSGWTIDVDDDADWPAPPALVPVISFSVGPKSASYPYLANDLVNISTLLASPHVLVVLAAGNCGALGEGTMSPWAQAPWVLSVGGTTDEEGTTLGPYSSRGTSGDPDSGPDVVAYGRSVLPPYPQGTSFAAPRVAHLARLVTAAFAQLGREIRLAEGAEPHGVPLVGLGMIDDWGDDFDSLPFDVVSVPALPIIGVDAASVAKAVTAAKEAGIGVDVNVNPQFLRTFLLGCATEMAGYAAHEVGRGFLDAKRVVKGLAAVTFSDVIGWFSSESVEGDAAARFDGYPVFVAEDLELLDQVLRSTGPHVQYDFRSQKVEWLPHGPS